MSGWIGVDLDGTLAEYDEWVSPAHIGNPVPAMVRRVQMWLLANVRVVIVTARVNPGSTDESRAAAQQARDAIRDWTHKWIGRPLTATYCKDYAMLQLWDARAVGVVRNQGVCAANDAVRKALQLLYNYGVGRVELEGAALAAGYAVQYLDSSGRITDGRHQGALGNSLHDDGPDASILLEDTTVRASNLATEEQLAKAREMHATDDVSFDDDAVRQSSADGGVWVQGWLWLPNDQ